MLLDELPPLGGLPQQVPEVVRVLLGPAAGGDRHGNAASVSAAQNPFHLNHPHINAAESC